MKELSHILGLSGSITITSSRVEIEISGEAITLETFLDALASKAPPLVCIPEAPKIQRFVQRPSTIALERCFPILLIS